MFQGLREHSPVFILEKGFPHKLTIGYVEKVSNPVPKDNSIATMQMFGQQQDMVVDVYVKIGDATQKLERLPANKSATTNEDNLNIFVTESRDIMLAEVENIERSSQSELDKMPYYTSVVESCAEIKRRLNPQLAKEQERDEEIGELKKRMGGIESSLGNIEALLKSFNNNGTAKKKE